MIRYRCVDAQKAAGFPVAAACAAAGVTRSAYYAWTARRPSQRQQDDAGLVGEIRRIHGRSHGTYGAPRVHAELRRRGWVVNHKRVERLMRAHGIVGYRPRRRRGLTRPDAGAVRRAGRSDDSASSAVTLEGSSSPRPMAASTPTMRRTIFHKK